MARYNTPMLYKCPNCFGVFTAEEWGISETYTIKMAQEVLDLHPDNETTCPGCEETFTLKELEIEEPI